MTELSRLQSQYDAFLFASLGDIDVTPSVLSVLAREDVDPWQEAARLAELSPEQAINSLASKIWKSNSERWSPSDASILAVRLIGLLPSHTPLRFQSALDQRQQRRANVLAGRRDAICVNRRIGHTMQKSTGSAGAPTDSVSETVHEKELKPSSHGIGTDQDIGVPGLNR